MSMESVSNHVSTTAAYATASAKQTTKAGFLTLVNGIIWPRPQNCGFFYVKFIKI